MYLEKSRKLKKFVELFSDPHTYLVTQFSTCKTANELAIPLYTYQLIYPNRVPPDAPMFNQARHIIENALYNETRAWALSLGVSPQQVEEAVPFGPPTKLCTDYDVVPPSDEARAQAKEKREKDGIHFGTKVVITKNPDKVGQWDTRLPKHWSNPGRGVSRSGFKK